MFHTSTTQKVLQHRVFSLCTRHSMKTIRKKETKGVKETYTKLTSKPTDTHRDQTENMYLG